MRGQVDAPIELFVAIIILVASSALAFTVMQQTEEGKCIAQLKTQTQQLQEAMLDVALGSSGTKKSVVVTMPRCGGLLVTGLQFVYYNDPKFCRRCPGQYGGCWQLAPIAKKGEDAYYQVSEAITCVDMPGKTLTLTNDPAISCQRLSTSPCLPGESEPQCATKYGIPKEVYSGYPRNDPSRWVTMGGDRNQAYIVNITKNVATSAGEQTELRICAVPLR